MGDLDPLKKIEPQHHPPEPKGTQVSSLQRLLWYEFCCERTFIRASQDASRDDRL